MWSVALVGPQRKPVDFLATVRGDVIMTMKDIRRWMTLREYMGRINAIHAKANEEPAQIMDISANADDPFFLALKVLPAARSLPAESSYHTSDLSHWGLTYVAGRPPSTENASGDIQMRLSTLIVRGFCSTPSSTQGIFRTLKKETTGCSLVCSLRWRQSKARIEGTVVAIAFSGFSFLSRYVPLPAPSSKRTKRGSKHTLPRCTANRRFLTDFDTFAILGGACYRETRLPFLDERTAKNQQGYD